MSEIKKAVQVKPKKPKLSQEELDQQVLEICGLIEEEETIPSSFEDLTQTVLNPESMTSEEELKEESSQFLKGFLEKIASTDFEEECETVGQKLNLPKQVVAKNFIMRTLGVIGDCLGIVVETGRGFVMSLINIVAWVLRQGVNIIFNVAHAIARLITLNQTAKA